MCLQEKRKRVLIEHLPNVFWLAPRAQLRSYPVPYLMQVNGLPERKPLVNLDADEMAALRAIQK
jgi:hypothetical protein